MPVALYLVEALTVVSAVAFLLAGTTVVVFAEYFLKLSLLLFWVFIFSLRRPCFWKAFRIYSLVRLQAIYPSVLMIMNGVEYVCMFGINILIGTVKEIVGK